MHFLQQQGQGTMPEPAAAGFLTVQLLFASMYEATHVFKTSILDLHIDLELFLWRLHLPRFHIAFATIPLFFTTARMPSGIIANVTRAVLTRQLFDGGGYSLSHFRLCKICSRIYEGARIFQFAYTIVQARNVCSRRRCCSTANLQKIH